MTVVSDRQGKYPENYASCPNNQEKTLIIGAKILMNDRDSCSDSQGKYPENCASCSNNYVKKTILIRANILLNHRDS